MDNTLKPVIARLARGEVLSQADSEATFNVIMSGQATPAQIAGVLMLLRLRGETVDELVGAVRALRANMIAIDVAPNTIDVCGTGGDGVGTLNISTAVTFVVAGLGVPVAKHGNRALSSRSGGADVLSALGIPLDIPIETLRATLDRAGCVFLFAPHHHAALRHAAGPRTELGTRTIFNLLGPLANPGGVLRQLTGVFDAAWARPVAETLKALGTTNAWLVHGQGLDELTIAGENTIVMLRHGAISERTLVPEEVGLVRAPIEMIRGGDPAHNAQALLDLLRGAKGPYRDTVLLNSAAALVVAEITSSLTIGLELAAASIDDGRALGALDRLRAATA